MLGGSIVPVADTVLGYETQTYQVKHPAFYKSILNEVLDSSGADGLERYKKKSGFIDSSHRQMMQINTNIPHIPFDKNILNEPCVVILNQREGSAKSERTNEILKDYTGRLTTIANTVALTNELANKSDACDYKKDAGMIHRGEHNNRVASCLNSILNLNVKDFSDKTDVLNLDEFTSILNSLSDGDHIRDCDRKALDERLRLLIKNTPTVILADANFTDAAIDYVRSIRDDIYIADFDYIKYDQPNAIFYESSGDVIGEIIDAIPAATKCITVCADTVVMCKTIEKALIEKGVINYRNLATNTSVEELIYHISTLDMFVTGDSGPMHIAAAFQVPTVAIFGPTKDKETSQWMNDKSTIVKKGLDCQPCMKRNCPLKHNNCMKLITAEEVLQTYDDFEL